MPNTQRPLSDVVSDVISEKSVPAIDACISGEMSGYSPVTPTQTIASYPQVPGQGVASLSVQYPDNTTIDLEFELEP